MTVADLGEKLGRKYVKPGGVLATVIAAAMLLVWHDDIDLSPADNPKGCQSAPLRNVYRPRRLKVVDTCVTETVTVIAARKERDGDYHVNVTPEHPELVNETNVSKQHGDLLVEFVPGDPRPKRFRRGQRLKLTGTLIEDMQHAPKGKPGWREIHPIFSVDEVVDPGTAPAPPARRIPGEEER